MVKLQQCHLPHRYKKQYVEETQNPLHIRLSGHHCDIKNNKTEKSVAAHFNIPLSDLAILVIEKVHVRSLDPTVNGWEPEEAPGDEAKSMASIKEALVLWQLNSVQSDLKLYITTTTICKACNCYHRYTLTGVCQHSHTHLGGSKYTYPSLVFIPTEVHTWFPPRWTQVGVSNTCMQAHIPGVMATLQWP